MAPEMQLTRAIRSKTRKGRPAKSVSSARSVDQVAPSREMERLQTRGRGETSNSHWIVVSVTTWAGTTEPQRRQEAAVSAGPLGAE